MKLTMTGLFWIGLAPTFVALALADVYPDNFRATGLPVLGVLAICGVWWFITILLDAPWLEFRPTALRGLLAGFVLSLAALFLVPFFPVIFRIPVPGLSPPDVIAGVFAICIFWRFIVILPDTPWLEFRPTLRRGLLTGFVLSVVAFFLGAFYVYGFSLSWGIWTPYYLPLAEVFLGVFAICGLWQIIVILPDVRWPGSLSGLIRVSLLAPPLLLYGIFWIMVSPDELLPMILVGIGFGAILIIAALGLGLRIYAVLVQVVSSLYGPFTGRNTTAAAPAPPQPASQPAAPAAPVSASTPLAPPPLAAPAPLAPPAYVVCPWCGHTNPANLIYCSNGACLMPLHSGNRFCIRCGVPAPVNARFCTACGSSA